MCRVDSRTAEGRGSQTVVPETVSRRCDNPYRAACVSLRRLRRRLIFLRGCLLLESPLPRRVGGVAQTQFGFFSVTVTGTDGRGRGLLSRWPSAECACAVKAIGFRLP